ncbi:hypothetical protein HPP92_014920 [Vanilla planifolia]|uniref:Uncharacterized protein n=1 Tax=Vanilla planifolia TaxID=51239 RepID=A0A835UT69_VANPL|nr:hypothetical protein HPP92_014920 [Vanilla planifolia]
MPQVPQSGNRGFGTGRGSAGGPIGGHLAQQHSSQPALSSFGSGFNFASMDNPNSQPSIGGPLSQAGLMTQASGIPAPVQGLSQTFGDGFSIGGMSQDFVDDFKSQGSHVQYNVSDFATQFLPTREHPPPQLKAKLRFELLRHLAVGLKTDSLCSSSVTSFLSGCRAGPLADFSLSPPTYSRPRFPQDLLVGVLQRLDHDSGATLLRWAKLHSLHSRYHALHLVLRAFLGAGMVPEALEALSEIRRDGKTPSLSVHAILFRILFRMGGF